MTDIPAIKPLEWGETSYGTPEVNTVVGVYRLNRAGDGGWRVSVKSEVLFDSDGRTNFATIEAAKAAAQSDFASRIRSCLLDKPEAVEAPGYSLVERLEQRISVYRDMTPEDGETWESWYFAAFDMLSGEISRLRAPADTDAAQNELSEARRKAFEEAAAIAENIGDLGNGWRSCRASSIAAAIRQRAEEPTNE